MQTAVPYMHEATKYVGPLLSPRHAEVLHVGRVPTRYHFQSQGNREAFGSKMRRIDHRNVQMARVPQVPPGSWRFSCSLESLAERLVCSDQDGLSDVSLHDRCAELARPASQG